MRKPLRLLASVALCFGLAHSAAAQDADTVVATVNGTEITFGHMILVRSGLPEQYQQLPDDVLFQGILDQLVNQTLLSTAEEAIETKRARMALENERRALLAAESAQVIALGSLTDEALQALYDEQFANADPGKEYNASHILVETEEEAGEIAQLIRDGADFAATAREKSTGPSGPSGGSLGWFEQGMMVAPFQEAVETLEVGAVSDPVQTQFGWHVIILNETRDKEAPSLDSVRSQLEGQIQQKAVEDRVAELTENATIDLADTSDIDSALLRNLELLDE